MSAKKLAKGPPPPKKLFLGNSFEALNCIWLNMMIRAYNPYTWSLRLEVTELTAQAIQQYVLQKNSTRLGQGRCSEGEDAHCQAS